MAMRSAQPTPNISNSRGRRSNLADAGAQRQSQQRTDSPIPDEPLPHPCIAGQPSQNSRPTPEDVERIAQLIRDARPLQRSNDLASQTVGREPLHHSRAIARPLQQQAQAACSGRNGQIVGLGAQNVVQSYCSCHYFTATRNASHCPHSDIYTVQPFLNYYPERRYVYQSSIEDVSTLKPTKVIHVQPNGRFSEHYPTTEPCRVQPIYIPLTIQPRQRKDGRWKLTTNRRLIGAGDHKERLDCFWMNRMQPKEDDEDYDVVYPLYSNSDSDLSAHPATDASVEVKHHKGSSLTPSGLNATPSHHDVYRDGNEDRANVYFGVHNSVAIKVVFGLIMFSILIILLFTCLVLITRLRYSQREENNLIGAIITSRQPYGNLNRGKSPYVITPTKKIARELFAFEKLPKEIECDSTDIAAVLLFLAKNNEPPNGIMFYPIHPSARLVQRPRTKFDDLLLSPYQWQSELPKMLLPIKDTENSSKKTNSSKRDFFDARQKEILDEDERNRRNSARSSQLEAKNLAHLDLKTTSTRKHS